MGQTLGEIAKRNQEFVVASPLYAEPLGMCGLFNLFMELDSQYDNVLDRSNLESRRREWIRLTKAERTATLLNQIVDDSYEVIDAYKQGGEPLPSDFGPFV